MAKIDFSKIYSYSKISLFDKCPKQYYFNYLDPEIAPIKKQFKKQRDYQTKGLAVHGAITLFYYLPSSKRNFKNLKKSLEKAWFSEIDPQEKPPLRELGGFKSIEEERKAYLKALKLLKNFMQINEIKLPMFYLPTDSIKDSFNDYEQMIKPIAKEIFISGKFDRIDKTDNNNLKIIDYKTGAGEQDQSQLYFYKLLAELNFNRKVDVVSFYCLEKGEIKEFDVSKTDSDEIKNEVLKKIEQINNTQEFSVKPSRMCNHCDFQEICPYGLK